MELLALEMVHHYQSQTRLPAAAAIEAIGVQSTQKHSPSPHTDARGDGRCKQDYAAIDNHINHLTCCSTTGFRVGRQLAERYTANRARTGEPLEVIKFICKEFWVAVFRKQVHVPLLCLQFC